VSASARDRLLLAGAELLEGASGADVSTRAICERAGVQAPTLYHHFGSKQGLLDAVLSHGLKAFLAARQTGGDGAADPIEAIREGWDLHVGFGLENPMFSTLVYGRAIPGRPCAVVADVEAMVLETLRPAAAQGRLRVAPEQAAAQIVAASSGVLMTLITQPPEAVDLGLSGQVRDAILAAITTAPRGSGAPRRKVAPRAAAAIALAAALEEDDAPLSATESALLREWLGRLV
jgi:AcrR family transcriptional regulator